MIWAIELDQTGSSLEYLLQLRPRTMLMTLDIGLEKQKQIRLRPAEGYPVSGPVNAEMSALCRGSVWGTFL